MPPGELSTSCSYCGSPLVDDATAATVIDRVAPFRIERSVAQTRLREYLAGRFWAPSALRRLRVDARNLRGVLVPFFAYAGVVRSEYDARIGIYWYRTESYTDAQGKRRTRTVRETEWFPLSGSAARRVQDHLVSASSGLPEAEANALEPFDLGWARPFDARFVSGFQAELPSIDRAQADGVAAAELRDVEAARLERAFLPGDERSVGSISSRFSIEGCQAVALPVWMSTYTHAGKVYRLLVNGQTGLVTGPVPRSAAKIALAVVLGLLALAVPILLWKLGVSG
jgi:hypothetical protein